MTSRHQALLDIASPRGGTPDQREVAQSDLALEYPTRGERVYGMGDCPRPYYEQPEAAAHPGVFIPPDLSKLVGTPAAARVVALDFETYYDSEYSVSRMGYHAYTHDRRFRAYAAAVAPVDPPAAPEAVMGDLSAAPWEAWLHGALVVAHNATFDRHVFDRLQEQGVIPAIVRPAGWICTAAMSRYFQCPSDLAGAVRAILGRELPKHERARARGRGRDQGALFDDPAEREYVLADAVAAADLWRAAGHLWPEHERLLWRLTEAMGDAGIALDCDLAERLRDQCTAKRLEAISRLPWAADGKSKPLSTTALNAACKAAGVTPPPSTAEGSPELAAWAEQFKAYPAPGWVAAMQDARRFNRRALLFQTMLDRMKLNGRMEAHTMYYGATPGRWSGGGHGLNLQNLNTDPEEGDLRGCLIPERGCSLIVIDLAQIEARVLLWAVGDVETLDRVRDGESVYEAHARATMGWTGGTLKDEDSGLYKLAKARVLGLGYGCGAEKFVAVAKAIAGLDLPLAEARRAVNDYRTSNRGVVDFWRKCEADFKACDGGTFAMPLPSGRFLRYRNVHAADGTAEQTKGEPSFVYGGLLVENYVQATARDLFADRLLTLVDAGIRPVLTVHDEYVIEAPTEDAPDVLRQAEAIITTPPPWAGGLPVGVEGKIVQRYEK